MEPLNTLPMEKRIAQRQFLVKEKTPLLLDVGSPPDIRGLDELIHTGFVLIDKPAGPTSHQVSAWVRDILGLERTGHCGTLDPNVTGVLPVALDRGTRLVDALKDAGKEYVGIIHLHRNIPKKEIKEVLSDFQGRIYQFPPVKSSVKRRLRIREIYYLELLEVKGRDVLVKVGCQGGTYIRTLAVDVGDALGFGAHLKCLRRTKVGFFDESQSKNLHTLRDAWEIYGSDGDDSRLKKIIHPPEMMVKGLSRVIIKDTAVGAICHGANLGITGIQKIEVGIDKSDDVAVFTRKGSLVALGKASLSTDVILKARDGIAVVIKKVVMQPGTYPDVWKRAK